MNRWAHSTTENLIEQMREAARYVRGLPASDIEAILQTAADRIERLHELRVAAQEILPWLREVHEGRAMNADGIRVVRKFLEVWDR